MATEAAGDQEAFERLYRALYSPTYNYVRYRVDDRQTAEDLTSQVFIRLLERIGSYDPDKGPFKPWFYALTRNVIAGHFRAARLTLEPLREIVIRLFDPNSSPEEALASQDRQDRVLQALGHLPARDRDVLGLKFAFDLKHKEIAELTGLTESNVGVVVYRSLKKLRGILDRQEAERARTINEQEEAVDSG